MNENKPNNEEDLLKQKLEKFELPVEDFVFEAIQTEVAPASSKPQKGIWFWTVLIGSVVIVFVGLLFFLGPFDEPAAQDPGKTPGNVEVNEPQVAVPYGTTENEAPVTSLQNNKVQEGEDVEPSGPQSEKGKAKLEPATQPRALGTSEILASSANVPQKESTQAAGQNALSQKASDGSSGQDIPDLKEHSSGLENPEKNALTGEGTSILGTGMVVDRHLPDEIAVTDTLRNNSANNFPSQPEPEGSGEAVVVDNPTDSTGISGEGLRLEEKAPTTKFGLQAFGGVGFSYRILRSPANEALQAHKNEHERYGLSFSFGLGGRYYFTDALYAGAGFGYASYSERYAFHHDSISHSTANTYNYIQVPFTLGVRLFERDRLALYGQVGIVWNVLTEAQSSWVDPHSLSAVSHSNTGPMHPFQENAFQSTLGLDIAFKLNAHWQVNLMPNASIFLNSVYLQSTNLDQKPYAGSLHIGVTRRF